MAVGPGRIIGWSIAAILSFLALGVAAFVLALIWGLVQAVSK